MMNAMQVQHADERNLLMIVCLASTPKCSYQMMLYKRTRLMGTKMTAKVMQTDFNSRLPNKPSKVMTVSLPPSISVSTLTLGPR